MQDPVSKATPAGRVRLSSPLGVRTRREESPPATATSAGLLVTSVLEGKGKDGVWIVGRIRDHQQHFDYSSVLKRQIKYPDVSCTTNVISLFFWVSRD